MLANFFGVFTVFWRVNKMASQYSILSVLIRPEIQEKVSVGMLLFDENEVLFAYSPNKLRVSKELLPTSSYHLLQKTLIGVERKIDENESDYSPKRGFKIFKNRVFDNTFSVSYLEYLSRYSNNLLSFSKPKEINIDLKFDNFKSLFEKYVDVILEAKIEKPKLKPFETIKEKFKGVINDYYDIQLEITPNQVKNLITPVRIDFSGKNNIDVYAQTIDMEATPATVINHINSFVQLKAAYENNEEEMKDFIIAQEPSKKGFPKQHDIWQQLRKSPILNYIELAESEKLISYAKSHNVIPLSQAE